MKLSELTEELVTQAIEAAVAEKGTDFVYGKPLGGRCLYRADGEPSCLVGNVLARVGVEYDPDWEYRDAYSVVMTGGGPEDVAIALEEAQSTQDMGETWGSALAAYFDSLKFSAKGS